MNPQQKFDRENRKVFFQAVRLAAGRLFSPGHPRRGWENLVHLTGQALFQLRQNRRRAAAARRGRTVPGILIASVTRRCNLDCAGCYSRSLRPGSSAELSDDRFMELFAQAADMGTATILVAGGEPLLRPGLLARLASLKGVMFPVFTNGLLLEGEILETFRKGHLIPVLSLEGDSGFTDRRRGEGIHGMVLRRMEELNRQGMIFGLSVTLTSENTDRILSEPFLKRAAELGAGVLFLVEYVPVAPDTEHLVLTPEQKEALLVSGRFDRHPFLTVCLPGDEEAFGGCLAAGRGFIHLADDGALEACPFAPFSDSSAAELPLEEALNSPLMQAIRARHSELTETRGGCALWNRKGWVASLGVCGVRGTLPAMPEDQAPVPGEEQAPEPALRN